VSGAAAGPGADAGALRELRRQVGDLSQLASTREVRLSDGNEDGVRAIDVRVSGGLSALVLADRGMDLGPAWAGGHQLSWQSPTGMVHPAHFDERNWLRSFHGGMLVTCGLQNVGPPNVDEGVEHGIHGRVSHIPARNVVHRVVEDAGRLVAEVSGEMRETDVYGSDLVLRRTLRFPMGETRVLVHDEVENQGYEDAVLMLLYHVNVGWPVVAPGARLLSPAVEVVGREKTSQDVVSEHAEFPPPQDGFGQLVYHHRLPDPDAPSATISIANERFEPTGGIALSVTFDPRQLPWLWQWRMLGPGMYLTGLEPASCGILGRAEERARGTLATMRPGEVRMFDVAIEATLGAGVADMVRRHEEGAR
jgi:hypothetical protein